MTIDTAALETLLGQHTIKQGRQRDLPAAAIPELKWLAEQAAAGRPMTFQGTLELLRTRHGVAAMTRGALRNALTRAGIAPWFKG